MVTFSCDRCNDTVKKPKANQHAQKCRAPLTCIDCSKTFDNGDWSVHNACITEAEAYQGALYKPTKKELKRKASEKEKEKADVGNLKQTKDKKISKKSHKSKKEKKEKKSKKAKAVEV